MSSDEVGSAPEAPGLPPVVARIEEGQKTPICVIVVGMAGSGKSSLMGQMQHHQNTKRQQENSSKKPSAEEEDEAVPRTETTGNLPTYCINLDPATHHLAYDAAIDIRDTINYKEVMKQHNLGPNGAILTSLNLLTTKFDQVMGILEKRAYGTKPPPAGDDAEEDSDVDVDMDYILVDTPGQIEAFTWSASGTIISESLASAFPTVLVFVVDTVRCASSPSTFISNMLYACSMFYRTRLPLVIAFNKNDVVPHDFAVEWMKDYEAFQEALDESMESNTNNSSTMSSTGFYGSLTRSLSLVLDEFYSNFTHCCGVSAVTGDGMEDFWGCVQKAAKEDFAMDYVEDLKNRMEEQTAKMRAIARSSARRMQRDIDQS